MRPSVVGAAVIVALLPCAAAAQSLSLTEAEALARLGPDSPRVRAARAGVDIARADVLAAARWPNPRVTYDRESVAGVTEHLAMIGQTLPITGVRRLNVDAASARVEASVRRADEQIRRLRGELRAAFADLWAAQERERALTSARDRLQEVAAVIARREAAGDAAGFDRLRAEREVLDLDAERDVASADRARAEAILAGFVTGGQASGSIVAVHSPGARAALPSLDELVAQAERTRGDLAALTYDAAAARLAERAAGRLAIPEPELVAGTKSSNAGGGDFGSVVTLHVSIPLFDRSRPERALARARAAQADAQLEASRSVLRAEIASLRALVVHRRDAADRHRAAIAQSADALERIAQVSYDAGERGILDLVDALRSAADARVRQVMLDAASRQSELQLDFASGWEIR